LTHDLIGLILRGLETSIQRVLINDVDEGTFFARIILQMENELGKKIIELDARPSDSIVLALQMKQPIHVSNKVLENVEDMSEILERILRKQD
jgi:bifunctional DNase/RNase